MHLGLSSVCKILAFIALVLRAGSSAAIIAAFAAFQSRLFRPLGEFLDISYFLELRRAETCLPTMLPEEFCWCASVLMTDDSTIV